jgi:hypothetical protein
VVIGGGKTIPMPAPCADVDNAGVGWEETSDDEDEDKLDAQEEIESKLNPPVHPTESKLVD